MEWKFLRTLLIAGLLLLLCAMLILMSSCEVLKRKSEVRTDSTKVNKVDSGSVKKNEVTTKTDSEWWREIVNFRDTIINNTTTPVYNYPVQIIREGGSAQIVSKSINYDSLWNNKMDSLVLKLSKSDKSKEVKTPGAWVIYLALALAALAFLSKFVTIKKI